MDRWKPALITLLVFVALFPVITQETIWKPASAEAPVTIDMTLVTQNRSNIIDVTYIGFRMVNTADNSPFLGKLAIKNLTGQWFANVRALVCP